MSKPIKELIKEAQELGINLHDYVAQEVYGKVNMETRHRAKQLTFGILYGASPQAEDQMHRFGVVPFEVGIFDDDGLVSTLQVHATSALDARCIAYIIDRGRKMQQWDSEQIELALACTEVVG